MGCGSCKSSKASVPLSSNIDDTLVHQSVSFLSNNPNFSQISEPFKPLLQPDLHQGGSPRNPRTDRSNKSEEALTASKEFIKLLQNSSETSSNSQKEYKIYVWTKNRKTLRQVFPSRSFHETLNINNRLIEASFTIYSSSVPIIIDCVAYLIEKAEDFKEIFRINQQFKHVWVQALLTREKDTKIEEMSETLGIQVMRNCKDLFKKICSEDLNLVNMLKNLFNKIDDNKNGEIDFSELLKGFKEIRDDISLEEIREGLKRIDVDKDGKISFEEFCFWWKKGRQGPLSFSESALGWAKKITINSPETRILLRKMTQNRQIIDKKTHKKEFSLVIGKDFFPQTQVQVKLGKSSMREKILNEVNFKLGLFSQEVWISMHSFLHEKISEARQSFLKQQAEILIESISGNFIDGKKLRDAIEVDVQVVDSEFFLTFILDTENESMEPFSKFLLKLDELLTSPTNDFLDLQLASIEPFHKFFLKGSNFFSSLGTDFKISGFLIHWNKMMSVICASFPFFPSLYPILSFFLLGSSNFELNFATLKEFLETFPGFSSGMFDFSEIFTPRLLQFFEEISTLFKDSLSVYSRCSNLGGLLKIRSADLISKLLQNRE